MVEYLREAAFDLLGDELPYSFTAEVEEFREAERPIYIRVTLFVERESQKAIVIGRGGAHHQGDRGPREELGWKI